MALLDTIARPVAPEIAPPSKAQDLVPGLLLFFARPSLLQTWAEFFGHEWRHVGVTVQTEDGLRIASYGPRKCFRLDDPAEILDAYVRVGVARIFHHDVEVVEIERFCRSFMHLERSDAPYTFSSVLMGPVHLMARKRHNGPIRSFLFGLVYLYCLFQRARYNDRGAYGCSTFIWEAIAEVRNDVLRIPLSAHPDDDAAYATPSTASDELFARWLCGPTELWQAISEANRCELDLTDLDLSDRDLTVLDLTDRDLTDRDLTVLDLRELDLDDSDSDSLNTHMVDDSTLEGSSERGVGSSELEPLSEVVIDLRTVSEHCLIAPGMHLAN